MQDNIILEGELPAPSNCLDFGIHHDKQMELISKAQDKILQLQPQTKITALCNGAENCWNIIDALEPMAIDTLEYENSKYC